MLDHKNIFYFFSRLAITFFFDFSEGFLLYCFMIVLCFGTLYIGVWVGSSVGEIFELIIGRKCSLNQRKRLTIMI